MAGSPEPPAELAAALAASSTARAAYEALPPSHRHEYDRWVGEAVKAETRSRRAAQAGGRLTAERSGRPSSAPARPSSPGS